MSSQTEIKIDKGVPIPERPKASASKYPWADLKVGDSFVVPRKDGEHIGKTRTRATVALQYSRQNHGFTFCTRTIEDGSGIRVWRLT